MWLKWKWKYNLKIKYPDFSKVSSIPRYIESRSTKKLPWHVNYLKFWKCVQCKQESSLEWCFVLVTFWPTLTHRFVHYIYNNYLCNQWLSPRMLWVRISIKARCTTLWDKVYQWFSPGPLGSSTNKTDCYDITETLLKVALRHHNAKQNQYSVL